MTDLFGAAELHVLAWLVAWAIHDAQQEASGAQPRGRAHSHLALARDVVDGLALAGELVDPPHNYHRWRLSWRLQDYATQRTIYSFHVQSPEADRLLSQACTLSALARLVWDPRVHGQCRTSLVIRDELARAESHARWALNSIDTIKRLRRHPGLAAARREWHAALCQVENLTVELREQERREARC